MKKFMEQLKPQERRWVVGIGFVTFIILNYLLVWGHFKDWGRNSARMEAADKKITVYRAELAHESDYKRRISQLQSVSGDEILPEDQAIQLEYFYRSKASEARVSILSNSHMNSRTNDPFFLEQEVSLNTLSDESALVDFLYRLSAGNSMVRVRAISLRPDPPHHQLSANVTITASYLKKPQAPARPAAAPANSATPTAPAVTAKPAATPGPTGGPLAVRTNNFPTIPGKAGAVTNKTANINIKRQ